MAEEPSFARPLDNRSRRNETAENSNGFSRTYQGRNEYMTDDQGYSAYSMGSRQREHRENTVPSSRLYDSRDEYMKDDRHYSRQEKPRNIRDPERIPFQNRQVNEMRDPSSVLESPRDSSAPSDFMIHRGSSDTIPMARQMVDMSERNRSVVDRSLPKAKDVRARQMLQSTSSALQRSRGATMDRGDASSVASSSRRSGGVPRFARTPKQRRNPGVKALLEIRRLQKSVNMLIPKIGLQRVVREVVGELFPNEGYRFTKTALEALQEGAEAALIQAFGDARLCAQHAKRVTVMPRDIQLVRNLQNW
ncbi:unnamed protein product [Heligmosomoides polygyrus]|uniref:Histone domain-containing protein n=1 Tax=Heligmosomoides polygyrus TaxID=6339 RepID=A0A3P7ZFI0_HELPZ|nr:unnamed protein product [Heligmosomoides polygyrus]